MKTELYRVETTFLGADAPSRFYFDEAEKAENFVEKECDNGVTEIVGIISDRRLNYFDGCTWNELNYGQDHKLKEVILEPEGWYETKSLGEVYTDEYSKVIKSISDGRAIYPYRLRMVRDGFGGWKSDGWDNCSGQYTVKYLARLMREGKATRNASAWQRAEREA